LPTVEEELWKALNKARLVFPTPNPLLEAGEPIWEGCEYSKCGRTDKGVSAFGQVVGIRVRSNESLAQEQPARPKEEVFGDTDIGEAQKSQHADILSPLLNPDTIENRPSSPKSPTMNLSLESSSFHHIKDELPYCQILNRILPPDIRILAWCPDPPPNFSARFSCKERQYRYFFTQPAFAPTAGSTGLPTNQDASIAIPEQKSRREGWLDIKAMRVAAHKFVGLHDFRNFCKIDASKQIENFERRIFHADIQRVDPGQNQPTTPDTSSSSLSETPTADVDASHAAPLSTPAIYAFTLHGSAFLWHQVRHMIAILFFIGQGLEPPSLIDTLLDVHKTPCKPQYEMADDAPLVLWDCIFPAEGSESREDALEWVYAKDTENTGGKGGLVDDMWRVWRGRKMDEVLAGSLMDVVAAQGRSKREDVGIEEGQTGRGGESRSQKVFQGGDAPRRAGRYIPVMQKPRMQSVEAINARYAKRKGFEQNEEPREQGFRRMSAESGDAASYV